MSESGADGGECGKDVFRVRSCPLACPGFADMAVVDGYLHFFFALPIEHLSVQDWAGNRPALPPPPALPRWHRKVCQLRVWRRGIGARQAGAPPSSTLAPPSPHDHPVA